MCGDGANDCGALKAAHVGISLSEAESSVASPFTSKEPNISCVPKVIKEGRAALITSFGVFKFMICYSLAEFASAIILYGIDANLNSLQYLFIDICLILHFASFFGYTKAYGSKLAKIPKMDSLLSLIPLLSIIFNMAIIVAVQVAAYHLIQEYDWFTPFHFNPQEPTNFLSYENYAVFSVSLFQYITLAIIFSRGKPYRKPIYTNFILSSSLLLMTAFCTYMTLQAPKWLESLLELKMPVTFDGRLMIIGLAAANFVISFIFEEIILTYLIQSKIQPALRKIRRSKKGFDEVEGYLDLRNGKLTVANQSSDVTTKL